MAGSIRLCLGLVLLSVGLLFSGVACAQKPITLQAEDARLDQVWVGSQRAGFDGKGYVFGFRNEVGKVEFSCNAPAGGFYDVAIRYYAPGRKGYSLLVNGEPFSGMFLSTGEGFAVHDAGLIELKKGANTLVIEKGWGHYDIDWIRLTPVTSPPKPIGISESLSDTKSSDETKQLMHYLVGQYGQKTQSGVMGDKDYQYIVDKTGVIPRIYQGDFIECSPSRVEHGNKDDNTAGRAIQRHQEGHIISLMWHWNAPKGLIDRMLTDEKGHQIDARWYKGFESKATTFDLDKALDDENSEEHRLLLRDIDVIAVELRKLADAKVPVLWRPLHEAEGTWFWWGDHGPERFVQLWRLMYERLVEHHQLHNLIWVYTSAGDPTWYPGDGYVDIVGIDAYVDLRDPLTELWTTLQKQHAGKKLLTISEYGGIPDVPRMQHYGAWWSYFVPWTDSNGPSKMSDVELKRIFSDPGVANLKK